MFLYKLWRYITIEPAYLLFYVSTEMMNFLYTNLYLQKVCRPSAFSEPNLNTPCEDEKSGLEFVTEVVNSAMMVSGSISVLITVLLIAYSDSRGGKRSPFIVFSISGQWLQSILLMLQTYFWKWPPFSGAILSIFLPDLFGGWITVMQFCVLLMYEKSSTENRHIGITSIVCIESLGRLVGRGVVGHLLNGVGFFYSFATCCLLLTLSLVCVFVFVREDKSNAAVGDVASLWEICCLKKSFKSLKVVLFPKKVWKHCLAIWLLQTLTALVYFNEIGEQSVFYLYFRHRFNWDEKQFSNYNAYRTATAIIGAFLCTFIMSKLLKIHDSIIGTLAGLMDTLAAISYFFASQDWQINTVPLLEILHGVELATCYSLASKFFTHEDFGNLNSVHLLFGLSVGLGVPAYSFLFKYTMDTFPNALFLLSIFLNAVICIIYGVTYFLSKDIK